MTRLSLRLWIQKGVPSGFGCVVHVVAKIDDSVFGILYLFRIWNGLREGSESINTIKSFDRNRDKETSLPHIQHHGQQFCRCSTQFFRLSAREHRLDSDDSHHIQVLRKSIGVYRIEKGERMKRINVIWFSKNGNSFRDWINYIIKEIGVIAFVTQ